MAVEENRGAEATSRSAAPAPLPRPRPRGGLDQAVVRIRDASGSVVGTAFQVGRREIFTCAHVVEHSPDGPIRVEFPLVGDQAEATARVIRYVPVQADDAGDIAVLRLDTDPPAEVIPVQFVAADDLWGHPYRIFGFPAGHDHGVWSSGVLRGRQGAGWVQMDAAGPTGYAVEPGFSGAPVWDEELGGVVGMAVAAELDGAVRAAYMIPTAALVHAWPEAGDLTRPPCPYRGLAAFREQDASVFFGRTTLTGRLTDEIDRRNFVAVVGPSGSGKSSLVFGGVLPLIHRRPEWTTVSMRAARARSGVAALAAAFLPSLEPGLTETARLAALTRLTGALEQGHLHEVVRRCVALAGAERLLLVIDQFEEVLGNGLQDAAQLIGLVLGAVRGDGHEPLTIVVTMRADFLTEALQVPALAELLQESVTAVGRMERDRLREVIEGPLPHGVTYEPGLVDRILDDVGDDPGGLPLLEFALTLLWERQEHGLLTHAAYRELGGVEGTLAQYAERVYRERVTPGEQEMCKQLMVQLVRPAEAGQPVRRVARRAELGEARWALGRRLASTRLIVANQDAVGAETLELVHEALINGWERLRDWARQETRFRLWQEGVRRDVTEWEGVGRDNGALLRGMPLAEAVRWRDERPADVSDAERQYIGASSLFQGRAVRRLRMTVAALGVLVLIASGLGFLAVWRGRATQVQARESQARYLVGQAEALAGGIDYKNNDLALLLSAAAYHFSRNDQSLANLTAATSGYDHVSHLLVAGGSEAMAFSPTQREILAIHEGNRLALWNVITRQRVGSIPAAGSSSGSSIVFTPDGESVVYLQDKSDVGYRVYRWDVDSGSPTLVGEVLDPRDYAYDLRLSADGKRVVTCTEAGFQAWLLGPAAKSPAFVPHEQEQNECAVALGADGNHLIFADGSDLVTWSLSAQQEIRRARVPLPESDLRLPVAADDARITSIVMSPDGRSAAIARQAGVVWWDIGKNRRIEGFGLGEFAGSGAPSVSADGRVAYFPDGTLVDLKLQEAKKIVPTDAENSATPTLNRDGSIGAYGSGGVIRIVEFDDFDPLVIQDADDVVLSGTGDRATAVGVDGRVAVWSLGPPLRRAGVWNAGDPASPDWLGALSGGGGAYATVDHDGQMRLWNLTTQRPAARDLANGWSALQAISLDVDGDYLAAVGSSQVSVVRTADGKVTGAVALPGEFVAETIEVSRHGRFVAVSEADSGKPIVWDFSSAEPVVVPIPADVGSPTFSPDGRWLAASDAGGVIVWDIERRAEHRRFRAESVQGFDPGGAYIALNVRGRLASRNYMEVRRLHDGSLVRTVDIGGFGEVEFAVDDTDLIIVNDGLVTRYPLDASSALGRACHLVGRDLTPAEWKTYAEGFPYEKVCG